MKRLFLLLWLLALAWPAQAAVTQLNVKAFGAKGDGATDDTTAIAAAITAATAQASKPSIYLPQGTYKLTYALTIATNDITFYGDGNYATTLACATAGQRAITLKGERITLRDFCISSQVSNTVAAIRFAYARTSYVATSCRLANIRIINIGGTSCWENGVEFDADGEGTPYADNRWYSSHNTFDNVDVAGIAGKAFDLGRSDTICVNATSFKDCDIAGRQDYIATDDSIGIDLGQFQTLTISGGSYQSLAYGIRLIGTYPSPSVCAGLVIDTPYFEAFTKAAIYLCTTNTTCFGQIRAGYLNCSTLDAAAQAALMLNGFSGRVSFADTPAYSADATHRVLQVYTSPRTIIENGLLDASTANRYDWGDATLLTFQSGKLALNDYDLTAQLNVTSSNTVPIILNMDDVTLTQQGIKLLANSATNTDTRNWAMVLNSYRYGDLAFMNGTTNLADPVSTGTNIFALHDDAVNSFTLLHGFQGARFSLPGFGTPELTLESLSTAPSKVGLQLWATNSVNVDSRNWFIGANSTAYGDLEIRQSTSTNDSPVSGTVRVRIDRDGKVGINTNAPTESLEVDGNVKATGFIGDGSGLTGVSGTGSTNIADNGYVAEIRNATVATNLLVGATNVVDALAGKQPLDSTLTDLSTNTITGTGTIPLTSVTDLLAPIASPTFTGPVTLSSGGLLNQGWLQSSVQDVSGTDIDLGTGHLFSKSLGADTVFTFSNLTNGARWSVILTNGASWTVTWPTVTWLAGSAPVMDTGAGTVNVFSFVRAGGVTFGDANQKSKAILDTLGALANGAGLLRNDGAGVLSWDGTNYLSEVTYAAVTNALSLTGSTTTFLRSDGTQATPAGGSVPTGTVVNTGASTANALPTYSDTTGTNVQPSSVTVTGATNLNAGSVFVNTFQLRANSHSANSSFNLEQSGSSSVGNTLGTGSVDLQIGRNGVTKVASGANAFATGTNNTASGAQAFVGGSGNVVSGSSGVAFGTLQNVSGNNGAFATGYGNLVAGAWGAAFGARASSPLSGQFSHSNDYFASEGDAQFSRLIAYALMTVATSTTTNLLLDGNTLNLPANTTWTFRILVAARTTDAGTGDEESAGYAITGLIERDNTAANTRIVGSPTYTVIAEDDAAWDVAVSANTTSGALTITVTGNNETAIRWVATVDLTQVGG